MSCCGHTMYLARAKKKVCLSPSSCVCVLLPRRSTASISCRMVLTLRFRGPAKGYIEGLEHRLHEAESLLLALLPIISTEQLKCATDILTDGISTGVPGLKTRDSQSPGPHAIRSSPPVLNKKTGIEYWESFPLDSVDNIRKWQKDCLAHSGHSNAQTHSSLRNSIDDAHKNTHILAALHNASSSHSRSGSADLSNHTHRHHQSHSQSEPFRSMSSDSYRSGTSTPVHLSQHSNPHQQTSSQNQNQNQNPSQGTTPNWPSLSLFSPNTNNSSPAANTSSPNVNNANAGIGIGAEALLLQSFADSSWNQAQNMNTGMGMNTGMNGALPNSMSMEPGPMEVDTGFFTNDMTRRLFW
jgi:hypothetical protein